MQSQLQVFLPPTNFKSSGMMSHKHSLAVKYSFKMAAPKVASFEMNFFNMHVCMCTHDNKGTSEAETLVSGKAECSLTEDEDKKVSVFE